jgi:RNA-binding protein
LLSAKQRKQLKGLAHSLKPVVMIGQNGLTDAVVEEAGHALLAHELIKVRIRGAEDLQADAESLAAQTQAELVDVIGQIAIVYRAHPDKPTIKLVS